METSILLKAQVNAKRIYLLLNEVLDLSVQLAQALDRDDQVTIRMLISMRREPIAKLEQARNVLLEQKAALPPEDAQRLGELLNGGEAKSAEEIDLVNQMRANDKLLKQVLELDKRLNQKLTREKSIYQ